MPDAVHLDPTVLPTNVNMRNKNKADALLEFLEWCHADDYMGTDDDMPDHCNDWISGLSPEEVGDLAQIEFQKGI